MTKRPRISHDDSREFRDAVGKVRRIRSTHIEHGKPLPKPRLRKAAAHEQEQPGAAATDRLSDNYQPAEAEAEEALLFVRPGLQNGAVRKLRRGQFHIESDLDLHGMIIPIARVSVARFLDAAHDHHARCLLIIHGKGYRSQEGGPVLKTKLNNWLRQREDVMAFCSALPQHGGNGAVYVLLKRGK